jgi:GDP-L-fucose synthase
MKILITGANGYIGKSLYNALKDKHEVAIINRQKCDLTNSEDVHFYFLDAWVDVVIHCAVAGGHRLKNDEWKVMDENLMMYYNLLQNKKHFGKLIHFGSGAEIYKSEEPYGFSKSAIRNSILVNDNFYNLRIYGVFDENELDTRFIKANIKRYINKEPLSIYENKYMDFIYMPDLVSVVDYYIKETNPPKETECRYKGFSNLRSIAEEINTLSDYRVPIYITQEYGGSYIGTEFPIDLKYIGLEQGIKNVYKSLLNEAN